MFEQVFKNIDHELRKDAGCGSELDYGEQSSWILFLKYLEDLERDRAAAASLSGKPYQPILNEPYRWSSWAAPHTADGQLDHHNALTGEDLLRFVNSELFPYLAAFKQTAPDSATVE